EGTYLAWLDFRGVVADPAAHFLDRGVAMTDGALCGEAGRGFVRLNFAMPRPILREAITVLGRGRRSPS
ncbi:MAG TPA: hypothetical protein VLM05_06110, partial [Mycobacteriales bacterium]|nr:hypothetical protein [Mycobacteriales bacterium]